MHRNHHRETDWKTASEECLVKALDKAAELVDSATDFKSLESLIKTVSEVVGFSRMGGARRESGAGGGDDE